MVNPYRQYQKTSVTTASREKILLMLYEGAIRFTKQARFALKENKVADKGRCVSRATAILSELIATLDFDAGGDLAADLENLYVFMIDKMIEGNIKSSDEHFETVEKLLNTLYVAWKDVIENPRADGVPSPNLQAEEYNQYQSETESENSSDQKNKSAGEESEDSKVKTST